MKLATLACLVLACGSPAPAPIAPPPPVAGDERPPPITAPPPPPALPDDIASIRGSLDALSRRAWIGHYGPVRFAPDQDVAEETRDTYIPVDSVQPNVVVDANAELVRIMHESDGLRVLFWVRLSDLVPVPTEVLALRGSARASAPGDEDSAVRVYPGFRFTHVAEQGEMMDVRYEGRWATFRGLVPRASFGAVFEPREPPNRHGEATRARSNATIYERPGGRALASLRGDESPYFEHDVVIVGPEQSGFTRIALASPSTDEYRERVIARYEILGWVHTRELGMEPMGSVMSGRRVGHPTVSHRQLRVALTAGTPLRRSADGPVIGVVIEDGSHLADAAEGGGYWIDFPSSWGAMRLYTSEGHETTE